MITAKMCGLPPGALVRIDGKRATLGWCRSPVEDVAGVRFDGDDDFTVYDEETECPRVEVELEVKDSEVFAGGVPTGVVLNPDAMAKTGESEDDLTEEELLDGVKYVTQMGAAREHLLSALASMREDVLEVLDPSAGLNA